jgi:hypothetical protein
MMVIGTNRLEWIRDKTLPLTPDVRVRQTHLACHLLVQRSASRLRDVFETVSGADLPQFTLCADLL